VLDGEDLRPLREVLAGPAAGRLVRTQRPVAIEIDFSAANCRPRNFDGADLRGANFSKPTCAARPSKRETGSRRAGGRENLRALPARGRQPC